MVCTPTGAKGFKRVAQTTAVVRELWLPAERRLRRLRALELLAEVWRKAQFVNGVRVPNRP